MSGAPSKRTRSERVQSLGLPPNRFKQLLQNARNVGLIGRLGIAAGAALLMLLVCRTWLPPFAYRTGYMPAREMVARITFQVPDKTKTQVAQMQKRREVATFYSNRDQQLTQRREALKDKLFLILSADSYQQMSEEERAAFAEFYAGDETAGAEASPAAQFAALKSTLAGDPELKTLEEAVRQAMLPFHEMGLLKTLTHGIDEGNQRVIRVYPAGRPDEAQPVEVSRVRIAEAKIDIEKRLREQFRQRFPGDQSQAAAEMIYRWFTAELPTTLTYDETLSEQARQEAAETVGQVMTTYYAGVTPLAPAGRPIGAEHLELLRREWEQLTASMHWSDRLLRVAAYAGMIAALYLLCGSYIYFVDDRRLLYDARRLALLLGLMVLGVALCHLAAREKWQAEVIPLVLVAITAAVVYGRDLGLLLLAALSLSVTLFNGSDIADLVTMAAAATGCILLLGRIRSRTRLLHVGLIVSVLTGATVIGVGVVTGQTLSAAASGAGGDAIVRPHHFDVLFGALIREAAWVGACVVVSSLAMTGLLPLVEKTFGVQTDLSLLELGDASHPLLRQLAQRAPGTYNHSINVASIAEAAADAIGANGLLVRVGAYFHDIGKMFKPDYFVENQGQGPNQHDSLQPAMSTLVIIAHVKDGADLARSHHLPEPIIDFIMQHHGTTLVEYFYREATKRSEEDPHGETVSDKDFRYPGPKPLTLEAAVLMLADAVESASRTLVDPTPARIKSLVESIAMKKLIDGQFDECGLTLLQLNRIKQSLVKSLTAIYHARVKYPGQQSA